MQRYLYTVLEQTDTGIGKAVDFVVVVVIVVSITAFTLSTVPDLAVSYGSILEKIQLWSVLFFSVEYVLRMVAAGGKPSANGSVRAALVYMRSFYGVVDLLAILPFYLDASGFLSLRLLRLLRLFRLFKVGRYSRAMALLVSVLRKRSSQLGVFLFLSAILAFITATGIYYAENTAQPEVFSSIPASLWWSVVTLTTVGYGDAYPITVAGKFFTAIIIILSLGVVALPTGIVSAGLVEALKNGTTEGICPTCGRPIDPNSGQDPYHQGVPVSEETPSRPAGTPSISV